MKLRITPKRQTDAAAHTEVDLGEEEEEEEEEETVPL